MRGTVVNPVEAGFVRSLAKPGGNITGLTDVDTDLHAKRLELLTEIIPRLSRVAVLWTVHQQEQALNSVSAAAQAYGMDIQSVIAAASSGVEGLERGLSSIRRQRPGAMLVVSSEFLNDHRRRIVEFTMKNRIPTLSASTSFVDAGGLIAYGANSHDLSRRAAWYVDKILRGAKPAHLPVEQPTRFELTVNLKTAKQIGLTIPPHVLARADRVIK